MIMVIQMTINGDYVPEDRGGNHDDDADYWKKLYSQQSCDDAAVALQMHAHSAFFKLLAASAP